jgi:hypothetical protein
MPSIRLGMTCTKSSSLCEASGRSNLTIAELGPARDRARRWTARAIPSNTRSGAAFATVGLLRHWVPRKDKWGLCKASGRSNLTIAESARLVTGRGVGRPELSRLTPKGPAFVVVRLLRHCVPYKDERSLGEASSEAVSRWLSWCHLAEQAALPRVPVLTYDGR